MKKGIIIAVIVALVIGGFIYFVAGVSSTSAPIKRYEYSGSINQFVTAIKNYASTNPNVSVKITDTVGDRKADYGIYISIDMKINKDSISYNLECEKSDGATNKTTIQLVEAYNKTRITGGYIKDAKGVKPLVDDFESDFLTPLKNKQNINVIPL